MSEPYREQPRRSSVGTLMIIFIFGSALLLILIVVLAGFLFLNRDSVVGQVPDVPILGPQVNIVMPAIGNPFNDLTPIVIAAEAASDTPVKSLDLYVNGVLEGVQAAPQGSGNYFSANFTLSAPEAGTYTLIAQAVDENQLVGISDPVILEIEVSEPGDDKEDEDGNEEQGIDDFAAPVAFPPAPAGGAPLVPAPAPNQPLGPGAPYTPFQTGNGSANQPQTAPNAPALFVEQDGCSIVLNIQDLSDNEDGFAIYRADGQNGFVQVVSLAGQSDLDWVTYADNAKGEQLSYYVTAFNSVGALASNTQHVSKSLIDCPPIITALLPSVFIQLGSLNPDVPIDQGYCYRSFDGSPFARWPDSGYFEFDTQGDLSDGEIVSILLENLDGSTTPKTLLLACWSWDGAAAEYLGDAFFDNLDFENGAKKTVQGIGLDVELIYGIGDINMPGGPFSFDELPFQMELFDDSLPKVYTEFDYDFETCKTYLPPGTSEGIKKVSCQPYLEYTVDFPQPYLFYFPYCESMTNCVDYYEWLQKEQNGEGKFGFRIHETFTAGASIQNYSAPNRHVYVLPYRDCHTPRSFQVQAWWDPNDGPLLYGPLSEKVPLPICIDDVGLPPVETAEYRFVEVTFSTFELTNVDDGSLLGIPDDSVEMYGHLYINNSSYPFDLNVVPPENLSAIQTYLKSSGANNYSLLNVGLWGYEQYGLHWQTDYAAKYYDQDDGLVFIEDWRLCESNAVYPCEIWTPTQTESLPKQENNILRILVTPNRPFVIGANIWDSDQSSDHDIVCDGTVTFLGLDLAAIDSMDGVSFSLENDGDSGYCRIFGSVRVLKPSSQ